jgi:hypothetical protein
MYVEMGFQLNLYQQNTIFEESHFCLFWDVCSVVFKETQRRNATLYLEMLLIVDYLVFLGLGGWRYATGSSMPHPIW